MNVWIGTSGFSYLDWIGPFYPEGIRPNRMLGHYVRHFPIVELNFTYYKTPTPGMLLRLCRHVPEGFQFLIKIPGSLSHEENPEDLELFQDAIQAVNERAALAGLLCQLPQATHDKPGHRRWIESLAGELGQFKLAVEFRHRSWAKPEVNAWLADLGLDLVSVDAPDIPALYPRGLVQSSDRIYVRLHSRSSANWYSDDKSRYDYYYPDSEMAEWVRLLARADRTASTAYVLFNNCMRSQAVENAKKMARIMKQLAPQLQLIHPFADIPRFANQGVLFD